MPKVAFTECATRRVGVKREWASKDRDGMIGHGRQVIGNRKLTEMVCVAPL
jgi:hypothetical protein